MIKINNISQSFGDIKALSDVNITLNTGEITGLLGLNGAGKSTLMRLLYGLLVPTSGSIYIDDICVQKNPAKARAKLGVLPDDAGLYKRLSARENIAYFGRLQEMDESSLNTSIDALIKMLGMQDIADRKAEGFSLGERMKTALARAIVHSPNYIFLDEPTNGLDIITTRAVRHLLRSLRDDGKCVLFSSHLMHEVENLCDRIIVIVKGEVVADGTVDSVVAASGCSTLEDAFVKLTGVKELTCA